MSLLYEEPIHNDQKDIQVLVPADGFDRIVVDESKDIVSGQRMNLIWQPAQAVQQYA